MKRVIRGDVGVKLSEIQAMVPHARLVGGDVEIVDLTLDSREVQHGWAFCCTKGTRYDGHAFAPQAAAQGASALIVSRELPLDVPQLIVPSVRHALGPISSYLHRHPSERLDLVGITGTNGKTTTSYLLESILRTAGHNTGIIGTIEARYRNSQHPSIYTTPEAPELHRTLDEMVREGVDSVVMEVSSHGIDQHRIDATKFKVAIFTNLTAEHLDYHGTIEQYYSVKAQLFETVRTELALICVDDEWGRRLASQVTTPVITFGSHESADLQITEIDVSVGGTEVELKGLGYDVRLHVPIVGACNAANAAAAYLAGRSLGASHEVAVRGIESCESVSGRFQRIDEGQGFLVVVDYAHTPDSIRNLISTAREIIAPDNRVILVAGARGRRDRLKRPELGRAAATADLAVLTMDNPGDEDPSAIVDQLIAGTFDVPEKHFVVELDRARAIQFAVDHAQEGDAVLIVGRGHESTLRIGNRQVILDDRDAARSAIHDRMERAPLDRVSTSVPNLR